MQNRLSVLLHAHFHFSLFAAASCDGDASVYKHYKSKQDIFHTIFEETARRYEAFTDTISVHAQNSEQDMERWRNMSDCFIKHLRNGGREMEEKLNLQEYMSNGIENLMKTAVKVTLKNPAQSIFMAKPALETKAASGRRCV